MGIKLLEADVSKIRRHGEGQMARLRNRLVAGREEQRKQVQREIERALACLTDKEAKAEYDEWLRGAIKKQRLEQFHRTAHEAPKQAPARRYARDTAIHSQGRKVAPATQSTRKASSPVIPTVERASPPIGGVVCVAASSPAAIAGDTRLCVEFAPAFDSTVRYVDGVCKGSSSNRAMAMTHGNANAPFVSPQLRRGRLTVRRHRARQTWNNKSLTLSGFTVASLLILVPCLAVVILTARAPDGIRQSRLEKLNSNNSPIDITSQPSAIFDHADETMSSVTESASPLESAATISASEGKRIQKFFELLRSSRDALAERDTRRARSFLEQAAPMASNNHEASLLDRLRSLTSYNEQFWDATRRTIARLTPGDEIVFGNTRAIVVEKEQNWLSLRVNGRNELLDANDISTEWAVALAADSLAHDDVSTSVLRGAMMAANPSFSKQDVLSEWARASSTGDIELNNLEQVLDDRYEVE